MFVGGRRRARRAVRRGRLCAAEREDALAFEEEVPLLRVEQVEARQVHLQVVVFDLREVGPVGEVGGHPLRDPVLDVEARVRLDLVLERRIDRPVGDDAADRVRLDVEVERGGRRLESHERGGLREPQDSARPVLARHRAQIRQLVLPPDVPPDVDAPGLRAAAAIPQRSEGDGHLDRPALGVPAASRHPGGVPVAVRVPLVRDLRVPRPADRVHQELIAVAAIVKRVQDHADVVVLADVPAVAAHVVGDDPGRLAVAAPGGNIDVARVEEDPDERRLGGELSLVRILLDEIGDRRERPVEVLVKNRVDPGRLVHTDRAHGDAPCAVARHDGRWGEGRKSVRRILRGGDRRHREYQRQTHL